jgi:hypothetical protein
MKLIIVILFGCAMGARVAVSIVAAVAIPMSAAIAAAMFASMGFASVAHAQNPVDQPALILEVPLFELPYNMTDGGFAFPSMRQSLAISSDFYQGVHHLIGDENPPFLRKLGIILFDSATLTFPLSNAWMHEEWHRAVMGRHGIKSFNDTYNFPVGRGVISVSHVSDQDLINLKRDYPADQVRLESAGIESQYEQNLYLEKRRFYFDTKSWDRAVLFYNHLNNIAYLSTCASGESNTSTDQFNNEEGSDVPKRDFTGLDCDGWVYDLFRPDEPYAARGVHPSGVGINRYRKLSDLSEEEKQFLQLQVSLSYLNFVDPFVFGFDEFTSGENKWNVTLRHHITSFGYSIEGNFFLKSNGRNYFLTVHNFVNAARYFPGLTLELERWQLAESKVKITPRLSVWLQPENQRVKSTVSVPGLLASLQAAYPVSERFEITLGLEGKTEGWVAGSPYLERNVSLWGGVNVIF